MPQKKRFLIDVSMKAMPFPMRVLSKTEPEGQLTVANISARARINKEFEARWIDKFIHTLHQHRDKVGTKTLGANINDYLEALGATTVRIDFDYPFFVEKLTPVTKEKCLVKYHCTYSAKTSSLWEKPKIFFRINIPVITTDPASDPEKEGGLFGQLSVVSIEVDSRKEIFPEDLVEVADKHALSPVYSFLAPEDKIFIIQKAHSEQKSSVVMTDEIKTELALDRFIDWYSVNCANYGMLHSYSTAVGTAKDMWVPFSGYEDEYE